MYGKELAEFIVKSHGLKAGDRFAISGIATELEVITVLRDNHMILADCKGMSESDSLYLRDDYNLLSLMRGEPLAELVQTFHSTGWQE